MLGDSMGKKVKKTNKKKHKIVIEKKGEFIAVLSIGALLLIAGMLLLFLWYRPFVHWVEIRVGENCQMEVLNYYGYDTADLKYTYVYEDKQYEKIFYKASYQPPTSIALDNTRTYKIYINADDPLDAKLGMQGQPAALWLCILFIGMGVILIGSSLSYYPKKDKKKKSKRRHL